MAAEQAYYNTFVIIGHNEDCHNALESMLSTIRQLLLFQDILMCICNKNAHFSGHRNLRQSALLILSNTSSSDYHMRYGIVLFICHTFSVVRVQLWKDLMFTLHKFLSSALPSPYSYFNKSFSLLSIKPYLAFYTLSVLFMVLLKFIKSKFVCYLYL